MTNFFRKFILGYAKLAAPLIELTKKTAVWQRTDECRQAFNRLKQALVEAPALAIPDPAAPFELVTDSCGHGIEAVLLQHDKPVAFYSRNMTDAERCYVHHEQELLAAITALKVFRCYLLGNKFNLVTDDKPNTYLDTQPTLSRRRARWSEYLQRFHFNWMNLARRRNAHIRYGIKSWRIGRIVASNLAEAPDWQAKNTDLMVLLQGTRAVLRPLLDFVKLFAESQATEDTQVRANGKSSVWQGYLQIEGMDVNHTSGCSTYLSKALG